MTLGIKPSRPETGYGYIRVDTIELYRPTKVMQFLEKPSLELAKKYVNNGDYVWNSGMFIFEYKTILKELKIHSPSHYEVLDMIIPKIKNHNGIKLSNAVKDFFPLFKKISIDFAIMEKSSNVICIPVDFGWNDIGGYNSLVEVFKSDKDGNIVWTDFNSNENSWEKQFFSGCFYFCF